MSIKPRHVFLGAAVFFFSCQKEISPPPETTEIPELTAASKARVDVLRDVSTILEKVYTDPLALYEVNAAILSEYYADETVLLRDLLYPESSPVYQSPAFLARKPRIGAFRAAFTTTFRSGNYPALEKALGKAASQFKDNGLTAPSPVVPDTAMEIFSNSTGAAIYFPYSENFAGTFTPTWFDMINDPQWGPLATIVTADREADTGPGKEAFRLYTNGIGEIRYRNVTVSDNYAEAKMTHIVGIGAEPNMPQQPPPPVPPPGVNRVFVGETRLKFKQWDSFISLSGNGGGSEIRICRVSGYLQPVNGQVTSFQDVIDIKFKRKDIRKEKWKRIYGVWDDDWVVGDTEQVFAVYEEDNGATITFSGSLNTTLKLDSLINVSGTIGFSVTRPSKDAIIRQLKISRNAYFIGAYQDQGHGFSSDKTFLLPPAIHGWPIYDGGANFSWTWPYNVY